MSLLRHSFKQSASIGIRGLPQIILAFYLLNSEDVSSLELMYLLQQTGNIVAIIFSFTLSGYIILLKKEQATEYKLDTLSLILITSAAITYILEIVQIQIALYFMSISFRNIYFRLRNTNLLIYIPSASLAALILLEKSGLPLIDWVNIWLISATVLYCLPDQIKFDWDLKITARRVLEASSQSYRQGFLSIFLILVYIVERNTVYTLAVHEDVKKEIFFSLSVFNIATLIGSGALGVIGPRYIEEKFEKGEANRILKTLALLQVSTCTVIILWLLFFLDNGSNFFQILILKSICILSIFYYQAAQQRAVFTNAWLRALQSGLLMAFIWGPLYYIIQGVSRELELFYVLVSLGCVVAGFFSNRIRE